MQCRRVFACALELFLLTASASAQAPAVITGVVRDEAGTPVTSVAVSISSTEAAVSRQTISANDGTFAFKNLGAANDYRVTVTGAGFRNFVSDAMSLRSGESRQLDIVLGLGVTEQLNVAALRRAGTVTGLRQTIGPDLMRGIPLIDRGFIQLTSLAPGFTGRPDWPDAQGQHYWTNNVVVDSASGFSKWRGAPRSFYSGYGRESIRDVTILPDLYAADLGGALASVITATTRAGGATWTGSAFLFARHTALAAAPVFSAAKPTGSTTQFGGSLGGPLSPRTFLFASYDARRGRDHNVVSSPVQFGVTVPTNQDERIAFVRLDRRASDRQSVTARVNAQFFRWHDEPGALTLAGSGVAYTNDAHSGLFTHQWQLSDSASHELRVGYSRYVDLRKDLMPGVMVSRAAYSLEGGLLGPAGSGVDPEHTFEAHQTMFHATASHGLRVGSAVTFVAAHATSSGFARGAYYFAGGPADAPQPYLYIQSVDTGAGATTVDSRSVAVAGFVQDDWQAATNLTITAGIRYDIEQLYGVRNYSVPADKNNVQPRVGVAWRPSGSGRLIRVAAGLYNQQHVLHPIHQVDLQGVGGIATVVLPATSTAFPVFPAVYPPEVALRSAPHDVYRMAQNFRNGYSLQAGAGIEQSFQGLTVSADYLHLNGLDLLSVVDVNAPASISEPAQRSVEAADATRPLPPASGYRKLLTIGNDGRSWYRALQVKANGGISTLRLLASYTIAKAEDRANYELPEDSNNLAAEKGRAPTDIRHSLATAVVWRAPGANLLGRGWSLAALATFRSNRPYTITWGDDRNGTTQNDARPGARNTGRTGSYRVIDIAVSRAATLGRTTIESRLEVFNLLSTINYDEYVGALLSPLYGQPISAFPRRRGQLAVVVRF